MLCQNTTTSNTTAVTKSTLSQLAIPSQLAASQQQSADGGYPCNNMGITTENLSSMRFDAGVEEPYKNLLSLRRRSHLLTLNIVAHAVFSVSVLHEIKREITGLNITSTKERKKSSPAVGGLKVGVIGCGRLGTHLVNALLEFTRIDPNDVKISTRRPDALLENFKVKGIKYFRDNARAARDVDVLFLCFPPHEMSRVSDEIKGICAPACLVYSVVIGFNAKKISDLIEHDVVVKPMYSYRQEAYLDESEWNYREGVIGSLTMKDFKELTCPLSDDVDSKIVWVNDSLLHCVFLQSLNVCVCYGSPKQTMEESIQLCNRFQFWDMIGFQLEVISDMSFLLDDQKLYRISEFNDEMKTIMILDDNSSEFYRNFEEHYKLVLDRQADWANDMRDTQM